MGNNENIDNEECPEEWKEWIMDNGDIIRDILEETEDFLYDRIFSEEYDWINTCPDQAMGFILFILYENWKDSHKEYESPKLELVSKEDVRCQ